MTQQIPSHQQTDPAMLLQKACPTPADVPFFNHCMHLARGMGMSWEEGLRYVIEQREAM